MAVPQDTGYPMKWFKNQDFVRNIYECAICLEVVKDPVQVRNCGHQFCRSCLDKTLGNEPGHCPSCREEIHDEWIFEDNAASRAIGKLEVNCPSEGCEWDGCLSSLLKEHTEVCPFFNLSCSHEDCNQPIMRKDFEVHLGECQHRVVVCEYCNDYHVFKDKSEHHEICQKFPVECENQCSDISIPRDKMDEHVAKVCPNTFVECEYLAFGCEYKCKRCEMEEHLKYGMQNHLTLTRLEILRLKVKVTDAKVNQTGASIMKITDFTRKLSEAKDNKKLGRIEGDPFFSSPLGYKINLLVELNDTREEFKDNMGVYIRLMKSEHDEILPWPFKKKYTFTLIDQQDNEVDRENIVKTITPNSQDQFKRPLNNDNVCGFGCPNFASHRTLQTRKYARDDTVFITLIVES